MARSRSDAIVVAGAALSGARVLRKDFTSRITARLASTTLRRGIHSGSRGWLYAGAALTGLKWLQSAVGRKEEVFTLKLRPGESFEIREIARTK